MLKLRPANQDPELRAAVEVLRTTIPILKAGDHEQHKITFCVVIYTIRSDNSFRVIVSLFLLTVNPLCFNVSPTLSTQHCQLRTDS